MELYNNADIIFSIGGNDTLLDNMCHQGCHQQADLNNTVLPICVTFEESTSLLPVKIPEKECLPLLFADGVVIDHGERYSDAQINALLNQKVDKIEGKGLSTNDFTDTLLHKLESLSSIDCIQNIYIGDTKLQVIDNSVTIPKAMADALGLVKSSNAENKVSVDQNGYMEVNSLNVNKLSQTDGDVLILNSGESL